MNYDLNDPLVREMLVRNHRPAEDVAVTADGQGVVRCGHDLQPWPCSAVLVYREWRAQRSEEAQDW